MVDYIQKVPKTAVPLIGNPAPGQEIPWLMEAVRSFELASFEEAQNDVDFSAQWNAILASSGIGVSDGDKGDMVVSVGGTVWTFDPTVVTAFARLLIASADAIAARSNLGLGSAAVQAASAFAAASHTHTASQVSDFSEAVDDRVAVLIVPGSGITATYNDVANTLTLTATATPPKLTKLQRTTAQSIANATTADISFDTTAVLDDVAAFAGGSPTQLVTPSGYTKVRFKFWVSFTANGTGYRVCWVQKGAAEVRYDLRTAVSGQISTVEVETDWVTTTTGDVFTFKVQQNSGGALNTQTGNGLNAMVEAEWLA